ncbi:MAG: outer membrane protein assembly factor BamD [Pseudomonadota bacterium]
MSLRLLFLALLLACLPLRTAAAFELPGLSDIFGSKEEEDVKPAEPAEQIFAQAQQLQQNQQWKSAAKKYEEIEKYHPYSELAKKGRLQTAYCYFRADDFESAATAAERFVTLHPGSEDIPYAKFILGSAYYELIPDVTRDQSRTQKALNVFQEILQQYPNSEYAAQAEQRINMARDQLAGKEMDVGRFYIKQKSYLAAVNRFRVVVEQYQNTRHVEEALYRLTECYLVLGVVNEAQAAASVLGHNFPQSQWYKDAYALLQSNGTAPPAGGNSFGDSWITRAFKGITG